MSGQTHSITRSIQGLKAGDEEAVHHLWERYFQQLVKVARRRLGRSLRPYADEEDVALSVFKSICCGAAQGRFPKLHDRQDLWILVLMITRQKTIDLQRHERRQKRGGNHLRVDSIPQTDDEYGALQLLLEKPTPESLVELEDQLQFLLDGLRDDGLRKIAMWKMEAYTNPEIADLLKITVRSVERKLNLIRKSWSKELAK